LTNVSVVLIYLKVGSKKAIDDLQELWRNQGNSGGKKVCIVNWGDTFIERSFKTSQVKGDRKVGKAGGVQEGKG